jgi:hypothetical protein
MALVLTWLVELAVAVAFTGRRDVRMLAVVVAASLVSHPVVWWISANAPIAAWWPRVLSVELVVGVGEGALLRAAARVPEGVVVGLAMNAASFGVGLVLAPWLPGLRSVFG